MVNENDANECLEIVESIRADVGRILEQEASKRKEHLESVKSLKAF